MDRIIKFRGVAVSSGEMVYGCLIKKRYTAFAMWMIEDENGLGSDVVTETIGQFTGLKDKNGKDIFEGDYDNDFQVVHWCEKRSGWAISTYDFPTKEHICCHCYSCEGDFEIFELIDEIEIAGNVHQYKEKCQDF
jgi:uncharacterized phage protein (TIGR01671 family)